jgi:hypothetical protein
MRINIVGMLVVCCLVACCVPNAQAGYLAVGGGYGGEGETASLSLETGEFGIDLGDLELLLAVGFPIIPYGGENLPSDTIESKCPNNDCVEDRTEYKGTEMGGYAKIGIHFFVDNLYLNLIGGGTVVTESDIVRSPTTDRYYEESSDTVTNALYGLGLGFFPEVLDWQLVFTLDYDNRRGVTGLVGFYW